MDSEEQKEHLENLAEIRSIMERSSRFISLSGLSGVFVGTFALVGAYFAYLHEGRNSGGWTAYPPLSNIPAYVNNAFDYYLYFIIDALLVLTASLVIAFLLTLRQARKHNQSIWDRSAKRLLINILLPLAVGGIFCLLLIFVRGDFELVAPVTLIFYGLALINASKYTLSDIRSLGIVEVALGLIATVDIGHGLYYWAMGFGVMHIVYGAVMYYKYER